VAKIYLASQSPRRAELLRQIGIEFDAVPVDMDEQPLDNEEALAFARRMAREKARNAARQYRDRPLLAADTVVEIDGRILGKPRDEAHAARMLRRLSGRCHRVISAVALRGDAGIAVIESISQVAFRVLEADEISAYWRTGEPRDKAGGYAIQGRAAVFVRELSGSYSGVMGLPLFETAQLLRAIGVDPLIRA